jgi:excisionase family DNA binding protein
MQTTPPQSSLPEILTVPELAEYLDVPVRTVRFWRERGGGPTGFRVGKRLYFRADDVAAWLASMSANTGSPSDGLRPS